MINTVYTAMYTAMYKGILQDGGARFSIWICDDIGRNISIRKFGLQSLTFRLYTIKLWWLDKLLYIYM